MQTTIFVKTHINHGKKAVQIHQKITHIDDMMIHNIVKYLVQTRLHLWNIKTTNFKPESCPDDLLEICYFYISQTKSSLDNIFKRLCIIISSTCVIFLVNLDNIFIVVYKSFHEVVVSTRYVPINLSAILAHNSLITTKISYRWSYINE